MGAHEVYVGRRHRGFVERRPDGELEAATARIRGGDVRTVAGARMTEEPTKPWLSLAVVAGHQHQGRRLAQQEAASPAVEGPHALARERAQGVEATHHKPTEAIIAAGDHGISRPGAQQVRPDAEP